MTIRKPIIIRNQGVSSNPAFDKTLVETIAESISPSAGKFIKKLFKNQEDEERKNIQNQHNHQVIQMKELLRRMDAQMEAERKDNSKRIKKEVFWRNIGLSVGVIGLIISAVSLYIAFF